MKTYGEVELCVHSFVTMPPDGGEFSASCSGRFAIGERVTGGRCRGHWVETRAGLDALEKRKNRCPCREMNQDCGGTNPVV